jgi:drug/metabolite transporter (DMT)-like permease
MNVIDSASIRIQTFMASYYAQIILLLFGLFSVSFSSIFISISEQDLSSNSTIFNRFWITSIIYGAWIGSRSINNYHQNNNIESQSYSTDRLTPNLFTQDVTRDKYVIIMLIALGVCFCVNQVIWSWSLEHTSIANSTILHNLTPIFTVLGARLFLNQSVDQKFILGMLFAIIGSIIIEVEDLSFAFDRFQGDLAALASAILYSGYLLLIEKLRDQLDIFSIVFGCCFIGCIIVFPLLLIQQDSFFPHTLNAWFSVIALAVVCQVIGQALIAYSLKTISSGGVALLHLLCPCMSAIEAWFIFHQGLSLENLLGFIVILVGLYIGISNTIARQEKFDILDRK